MTEPPYLPGHFVWCNFPFSESPTSPGPRRHIGYILDIVGRRDRLYVAAALYTTTSSWPSGAPLPLGVIPVRDPKAAQMGQKPFVIDARRIALMPINSTFFPDLHRPEKGIQGTATETLKRQIEATMVRLVKRPELLQILGPERAAKPQSRKRRGDRER